MDDNAFAQQTNAGSALDNTIEDIASGDRADLRNLEHVAHFDKAEEELAGLLVRRNRPKKSAR